VVLDRNTGKELWEDGSPGDRILHGQWSTPSVGTIGGVLQVVHGQGDGFVRGYEAKTGKKLWEFDTNPKDSVWPKTRNEVISTPVIYNDVVYISNGQDPEHGEGVGHMYAIDATKRGDITQTGKIWEFDKIRRSISTSAIKDGIVYHPDFSGFLHAIDQKTGQEIWMHDMFASVWGSAFVADGKVYVGDEDGDVTVLQQGREKKILAENTMDSPISSTPITANGVMFIMTGNKLYAIQEGVQKK
jgi:outer membrane protein assembly factor BamB